VAGRAKFAEDADTIFFNGTKDQHMARNAGNLQFLRGGTDS
jgi:hypothetical protein